ncbi:hypothetical protein GCM10010219_59670 [Streptomyces netropsis]|nr:hypothetical protein GCM10010219_59670 [Streptomyces netropsis]
MSTARRSEGFQLSEDPDIWVAYERAIFTTELHRIINVITGINAPHAKRQPCGRDRTQHGDGAARYLVCCGPLGRRRHAGNAPGQNRPCRPHIRQPVNHCH